MIGLVKFIYSEKATKFCEIFPMLLTVCNVVKRQGKISQSFEAFSEYMNFMVRHQQSAYLRQVLTCFVFFFLSFLSSARNKFWHFFYYYITGLRRLDKIKLGLRFHSLTNHVLIFLFRGCFFSVNTQHQPKKLWADIIM